MRSQFFEYYRPSKAEFKKLWEECTFAFDANMLLNLYRYKPETRDQFIEILKLAKGRIWEPHQAVLEYFRRRLDVIQSQKDAYDRIRKLTEKSKTKFLGEAAEFSKHSTIDIKQIQSDIGKVFDDASAEISKIEETHPDFLDDDPTLAILTEILDGRVGAAYSDDILSQNYKIIDKRYARSIPPGYKDKTKDDDSRYGDAILWMQLLNKAKESVVPVIFVTDDLKEDWWYIHNGKTIGPRPELLREMEGEAGVKFYMYSSGQFIERASKFFKMKVDKEIIEDVKRTGRSTFTGEKFNEMLFLKNLIKTKMEITEKTRDDIEMREMEMDIVEHSISSPDNMNYYQNLELERDNAIRKLRDEESILRKLVIRREKIDRKFRRNDT